MVEANRAYALGDEQQLRSILEAWARSPEAVEGHDADAERLRLTRRIEQMEEHLQLLDDRLATLRDQGLPQLSRPSVAVPHPDVDVEGRLLDRLDPATQLERLSRFLWRRRQLATLRGEWMYFYTELESGGRGLAGVNINTGATERTVRISDPDERFINDEVTNLLYTANDNRLLAYVLNRP